MIIAIVFFIFLVIYLFSSGSAQKDPKKYQNTAYGFELTYPYSKKESRDKVVFFGRFRSQIFSISYFPEQNIQSVIDAWKKRGEYRDSPKVFEGDVKLQKCTSRQISLGTEQKKYSYYFISFGRNTVLLDARGMISETTREDTQEILNSFTCL